MPRYRVTRHEDWIAVMELEADSRRDAEQLAYEADWSETDSTFNDADNESIEAEELNEDGEPK